MQQQLLWTLLILVVACRSPKPSDANTTLNEAPTPAAGMGLKPVIVYSTSNNVDPTQAKIIAAAAGRAAKAAGLKVAADASGGAYSPSLALFARGIKHFDDAMAAEVASGPLHDLLTTSRDNTSINVALMLVDAATPLPTGANSTDIEDLPGAVKAMGTILQLAEGRLSEERFETLSERIDTFAATPILTVEQAGNLGQANGQAYRRIAQERKADWVVMLARIDISATDGMLGINFDTRIKPATGTQIVNDTVSAIGVSVLEYAPTLTAQSEEPAIAQFTVDRTYRANGATGKPMSGKFRFGRLVSQDLITLIQCGSNCKDEAVFGQIGRYYPTIRGYFNPGDIPYFPTLSAGMKVIAIGLAKWNHINILLRNIGIDFSDPMHPRVTPELSSFSMVLGDGQQSLQLSRESNIEFRGFDLYNHLVASNISDKLSSKVRTQLQQLNEASVNAFARQTQGLAQMISFAGNTTPPKGSLVAAKLADAGAWYCLDRGASQDGSFIYAFACHGAPNQQYVLMPDQTLTLVNTGLCVDINFNEPFDAGFRTYLHICHAGENQRWQKDERGVLVSDWRGPDGQAMCLDLHTGMQDPEGHTGGYALYAAACHAGINQKWKFSPDVAGLGP